MQNGISIKIVIIYALKAILWVTLVTSLLLNIFTYVMPIVKYYGNSMSPALTDGQICTVLKTENVQDGDIIAFYYNNSIIVRRVIATEGKRISIDISGAVTVDGETIEEPYVSKKTMGQSNITFPYSVPNNSFFVMGDNREVSMDSRLQEIGSIPKDRVIGKVILY